MGTRVSYPAEVKIKAVKMSLAHFHIVKSTLFKYEHCV